jgi:uncharacterized membrane-anchored protein
MHAHDHPLRASLMAETHARPTLAANVPGRARHEALLHDDGGRASRAALIELCEALGTPAPASTTDHHIVRLPGLTLKWERHGEFASWTVIADGGVVLPEALAGFTLPGARISAVEIDVRPVSGPLDRHTAVCPIGASPDVELAGSLVCSGKAAIWTDLGAGTDGLVHYVIQSDGVTGDRLGRLLRRIFEIETYRMAALLAFPLARDLRGDLDRLDREVRNAMEDVTTDEATVLDTLTRAARDAEQLATRTDFRFGAARAYRAIVEKRLSELEEIRVEGHQRLVTFLTRRFNPAMETVAACSRRIESLTDRIERASALLRTRVDLERSTQNQALLSSMNERAKLQLRLQEAVEGFSVVAISYYAFGLLQKVVHGLAGPLFHGNGDHLEGWIDAGLAVAVVLVVTIGLGFMRKRLRPK